MVTCVTCVISSLRGRISIISHKWIENENMPSFREILPIERAIFFNSVFFAYKEKKHVRLFNLL